MPIPWLRPDFSWRVGPDRPLDQGLKASSRSPAPTPSAETDIFRQFAEVCARAPGALAVEDGAHALTYGELLAAASRLAAEIAGLARPPQVAAISLAAPAWSPAAMLACLAAGVPFVTLDGRDPPARRREIIAAAGADVLIGDAATEAPASLRRLSVEGALQGAPIRWPTAPRDVDAPAFLLFTSGTTGQPKGVVNSQRALITRAAQYVEASRIGADDLMMPLGGLVTISGYRETFTALLAGAALHLVRPEAAGVNGLRDLIASRKPTLIYTVPSILRVVLAAGGPEDFASLRVLRLGGEAVLGADVALARERLPQRASVQVAYSSTETTGTQWFVPDDLELGPGPVPLGYMLPGVDYAVLGADGGPAPEGEAGELVVRSRAVALGTWRDGRLQPTPADGLDPGRRIHATGDLIRVDDDGLVRFAGRLDRQRKINGVRVEEAELEQRVRRVPGVEDASALTTDAGALVAFAVLGAAADANAARDIRAALRSSMPGGLQPARLHLVAALPRLASGKIDHEALRRLDAAEARTALPPPSAGPGGEPSQTVRALWTAFLPQARSDDVRWDEAGGDSLKLLTFVMELEKALGRRLPVEAFRGDMTLADAERAVLAAPQPGEGQAVGPRPTIFFFPGMYGDIQGTAQFRAILYRDVSFVAMQYPKAPRMLELASVDDLARLFADEIRAHQPTGEYLLAGYSFGGAVAAQTAAELAARGARVGFLGIIDTDVSAPREQYQDAPGRPPRTGGWTQQVNEQLVIWTTNRAVSLKLARALVWAVAHAPLRAAARAQLMTRVEGELRRRAFRDWVRGRPRTPAVSLFRSQEQRPAAPPDLGWAPIAQGLEITPFLGDHLACIHEALHLDANSRRFAAALQDAVAAQA
jgi:acyl-coenzyme A synthetase/AMP-(fatty) acid ligase/thioesterase domain-containing protein